MSQMEQGFAQNGNLPVITKGKIVLQPRFLRLLTSGLAKQQLQQSTNCKSASQQLVFSCFHYYEWCGEFGLINKTDYGLPLDYFCLLYTSPSPRDRTRSRMPS